MDVPKGSRAHISIRRPILTPDGQDLERAAALINAAGSVTLTGLARAEEGRAPEPTAAIVDTQ